jgi:hypothetical protein
MIPSAVFNMSDVWREDTSELFYMAARNDTF